MADKHFIRSQSEQTKVKGDFSADFGNNFDVRRLELEVDDISGNKKWVPAETVLENVVIFWRDFFLNYSPYKELPNSRYPLTEVGR